MYSRTMYYMNSYSTSALTHVRKDVFPLGIPIKCLERTLCHSVQVREIALKIIYKFHIAQWSQNRFLV